MNTQHQILTLPTRRIRRYGWKPDLPDHRDRVLTVPGPVIAELPSSTDLRYGCPDVYEQGRIGSCTANAIAAAFEFEVIKQKLPKFMPSRLFIYYNERKMEGTVPLDLGAQNRDGFKSIHLQGVCTETEWPYDDSPADEHIHMWPTDARAVLEPPPFVATEALRNIAVEYHRVVQEVSQMKGCLAMGYPFVVGFSVYSSFESVEVKTTGIVSMPEPGEPLIGGHATLVVGYDDTKGCWLVRNSWGADWDDNGYFWMPYAYLLNKSLSDDFWTLRLVTDGATLGS